MTVDKHNNIVDSTSGQMKLRKPALSYSHEFDKYESWYGRSCLGDKVIGCNELTLLCLSLYGLVGNAMIATEYGIVLSFVI